MSHSEESAREQQYEYKKILHSTYKELRSEADKIALEIGGRYEKMLSLVAGGALAISVTFIEKIAPSPMPGSRWVALSSWILLSGSIVTTLIAIAQSQKAQQKKIENMDSEILQRLNPEDDQYRDLDVISNPFVEKVKMMNDISTWTAVIGLACLLLFVFINFPSAKKNEQQEPAKSTTASSTGQSSDDKLVCSDKRPGGTATSSSAITSAEIGEKEMSTNQDQGTQSPSKPTQGTGPITESYVPTKCPVAPPPPPPAPKQGK